MIRRSLSFAVASATLLFSGCHHSAFPDVPAGYREFAYITNGKDNTVSVLDLVYLRQDRVLQVGRQPGGVVANPKRNEVYVVNAGDGTVTVIDTTKNQVVHTIGVQRKPYSISVDTDGRMAYVANSGSNTVSVIDLDQRRQVAVAGTGEEPGEAKISPDMLTLVVTNRASGSVSVYDVASAPDRTSDKAYPAPRLRAAFSGCAGATDATILPDSSKVFVACSNANQVMSIGLASAPESWAAKQDATSTHDRLLTLLDVGKTPVHLAMKPDGGEIFVSNFASNTISEISTSTNEVGGTYNIGPQPARGLVSEDNSTLWVSTFGSDSASVYSIDEGKLAGVVRTGPGPDAMAFSSDEHLLLLANSKSGDVAVIRTQGRDGNPALFTMLPAGSQPNAIAVKAIATAR